MKNVMFILMAMAVLLTSCGDKEDVTPTLKVGDTYQGGIVVDLENHLIMASDNQSSDGYFLNWSDANTICNDLVLNGYDNWRLPTLNECIKIKEFLGPGLGDNVDKYGLQESYWTSTIVVANGYYYTYLFVNGNPSGNDPNLLFKVRAVRTYTVE